MTRLALKPQLTLTHGLLTVLLKSLTALNLVAREAAHDYSRFSHALTSTATPVGLNVSASILVHFQIVRLNASASINIIA